MGGGGFAMEPENPLLDRFILSLAGKPKPRICFIPTASGDSESYQAKFLKAYEAEDCQPSILSLFKPHTRDLAGFVQSQDIIHVGGGNTRNLIALWREWGLDQALRKAYDRGTVLSGISAGMICWFEQGLTDSYGGPLEPLSCLGWLKGSACPHLDGEAERRPTYTRLIQSSRMLPGLALDDGSVALYRNEQLVECFSSRPHAKGWAFDAAAEARELPTRYLGSD